MGIKRYWSGADTTITNAFREDLITRGTGANMGASDVLEVFSIYGQTSLTGNHSDYSSELSRVLIKFSTADMSTDRTNGLIPQSGSMSWHLKMYNAEHGQTVPRNATYVVLPCKQDWEEGNGLDMEEYRDVTRDGEGANWMNYSKNKTWNRMGGEFYTSSDDSELAASVTLPEGIENLEVDVTRIVEQWIGGSPDGGSKSNYGFGVFLTESHESYWSSSNQPQGNTNVNLVAPNYNDLGGAYSRKNVSKAFRGILHNVHGAKTSYYTKKFFGKGSEHFFKRPVLEARWRPEGRDDRGQYYFSSSLLTQMENQHTLFFYNYFKGKLRNIPNLDSVNGNNRIYVSIYSGSLDNTYPTGNALTLVAENPASAPHGGSVHPVSGKPSIQTVVTGGMMSTGIYTASFAMTGEIGTTSGSPKDVKYLARCWDVWHNGLNSGSQVQYHTGTFVPKNISVTNIAPQTIHVTSVTNLKSIYNENEIGRFRLHVRPKNWNPNIYMKASIEIENQIMHSASYRIYRIVDDLSVIPYGTGSDEHTLLSYDVSGNFFDLDMNMLEKGYAYGIKMAYYNDSVGSWAEQPETFKFRVE